MWWQRCNSVQENKSYEDLDSVPESEFYIMTGFYSSRNYKPDEYENVKKIDRN